MDPIASVVVCNVRFAQGWSKEATWEHVPTKQNPVNTVSRGCAILELRSSFWFSVPFFLQKVENELEKKKSAVGFIAAAIQKDLVVVIVILVTPQTAQGICVYVPLRS